MSVLEETADALAAAAASGSHVRFAGGGTKRGWGSPVDPDVEISTLGLNRIAEHNAGDLTAVVGAGVRMRDLQEAVGREGQMLALDPPLGKDGGATVGGVVATADSGPLRHRHGSARDLVLGVTVALSDGTVARAGGQVIKNVAGYDLPKLFAGSHGTLGAILEVSVRLHPHPPATATAVGRSHDPGALARAATRLSHAALELQSLDARWSDGAGAVLARFGGTAAAEAAAATGAALSAEGLAAETLEDDEEAWARQREGQRSAAGTVVRVAGLQTQLAALLALADRLGAELVGRAGLGLSWVTLPPGPDAAAGVEELRLAVAPSPCVVQDAPPEVRDAVGAWGPQDPAAARLMRRVKERFDPAGACAPGLFAGGL